MYALSRAGKDSEKLAQGPVVLYLHDGAHLRRSGQALRSGSSTYRVVCCKRGISIQRGVKTERTYEAAAHYRPTAEAIAHERLDFPYR